MGEITLHSLTVKIPQKANAQNISSLQRSETYLHYDMSNEVLDTTRLNLVSEHLNRMELN